MKDSVDNSNCFVTRRLVHYSVTSLLIPLATLVMAPVSFGALANFEGAQTSPIRISADGTRLFAVNTPAARLSVFDLSRPSSPSLIAEIPVGLEPVSVNPRTNDEVWVVNQVSDSVSVVSVSKGIVTDTIQVSDEPMDVVFAGANQAFVSVSRSNEIRVVDTNTHAIKKTIPVFGGNPRALAVSPDGATVYAAFALSGNGTTIVPAQASPAQLLKPANLPPPPQVGLIIKADDPSWSWLIKYSLPDNDVVAIDAQALSVSTYFNQVGTINLGLAVNPLSGDLFVANTDARNLIHFEPNLRGHWVDNRVTRINVGTGQVTPFDLNPTINYSLPPTRATLQNALAQPTGIVFDPSGASMFVAAFGTDRVAQLDTNGRILSRIEIAGSSGAGANIDPKNKRGPRGLALNANSRKLYVLNRISNTITIVDTIFKSVLGEIPIGVNPTPFFIRAGRGFLYDAKLSGYGIGSCASCHVDGDMDHLAWDLGDPTGTVTTVTESGKRLIMHPMKGPMTTQTLRGLNGVAPYHWRGDKANFAAFNPAFDNLMAGAQLSQSDMTAYSNFIDSILFQANPFQNRDRSTPSALFGLNAISGQNTFDNAFLMAPEHATCNSCHVATPGPGTNSFIQNALSGVVNDDQPLKVPELRNLYQKLLFNRAGPQSIDGFGLDHPGDISTLQEFFSAGSFAAYSDTQKAEIGAYLISFDTGTAPAVGYSRTLTGTVGSTVGDWTLLESQASLGNIDLIANGMLDGQVHALIYQPGAARYVAADNSGAGPFTHAQLQSKIAAGGTLTLMGVYPGSGATISASH